MRRLHDRCACSIFHHSTSCVPMRRSQATRRRRRNPSLLSADLPSADGFSDVDDGAHQPTDAADPVALAAAAVSQKLEADVVSVQDVREWLVRSGMKAYEDVFTVNEINGAVLKTLTSEELRDDLKITNIRHRRDLCHAIARLVEATTTVEVDSLPEHGRILDHLSNIRTVHSWSRLGVQMLGFSVVTLRLSPNFRSTAVVTAASFYFCFVGVVALVYGILRYRAVISMIETSGSSTPKYNPDRSGIVIMLVLLLIAAGVSLALILLRGF